MCTVVTDPPVLLILQLNVLLCFSNIASLNIHHFIFIESTHTNPGSYTFTYQTEIAAALFKCTLALKFLPFSFYRKHTNKVSHTVHLHNYETRMSTGLSKWTQRHLAKS